MVFIFYSLLISEKIWVEFVFHQLLSIRCLSFYPSIHLTSIIPSWINHLFPPTQTILPLPPSSSFQLDNAASSHSTFTFSPHHFLGCSCLTEDTSTPSSPFLMAASWLGFMQQLALAEGILCGYDESCKEKGMLLFLSSFFLSLFNFAWIFHLYMSIGKSSKSIILKIFDKIIFFYCQLRFWL